MKPSETPRISAENRRSSASGLVRRGTYWLHIIVRGTAAFADAAAAGAPNLEVATRAPRSTPAATFQRLGSGRSPSGAPHG
eukprot:COSAG01_NODE_56527_length_317_cov_28.114679_1_plen_80_part_01